MANGDEYISGTVIANELNLEPIQVRKDLAITGIVGKPKRGYPVAPLIGAIEAYLNWDKRVDAIVVGAGNLGSALSRFPGFRQHGLYVAAAFDADLSKTGRKIQDTPVFPLAELGAKVAEMGIRVAILTVPSGNAQDVANLLVSAGIKAIWNFTNVKLKVADDVVVQNEDLSSGYAMLSIKCRLRKELQMVDAI
jgi:redox-sensing transcriptional repressor